MRYMLPIYIAQSAATSAPAVVWAMRNTHSSRVCRIKRLYLALGFHGTAATTSSRYNVCRFSGATPTGGTLLARVPKRSAFPASIVTDARVLDTGLTMGGATVGDPLISVGNQRQLAARAVFVLDEGLERDRYEIELAPGEGLCLQLAATAVIGDTVQGYVEWEEPLS